MQLAKKMQVWGVAELFGHQDLGSVAQLRNGLQFGKPRSFPSASSGSINQTQSKSRSNNLKSNQSQKSSMGSSITTPASSLSLGQKRKRDDETAATYQSKWPRSSDAARRQTDTASRATKTKPTPNIPSRRPNRPDSCLQRTKKHSIIEYSVV